MTLLKKVNKEKPKYEINNSIEQKAVPKSTNLENTSHLQKTWNSFIIYGNVGVLAGNFSQLNKKYSIKSNGHQGASNCVIACFFAQNTPIKHWSSKNVDAILNMGNTLYLTSIKQKENLCQIFIPVEKVYNCFYFENCKITVNIDIKLKKSETISSNVDAEIRTNVKKFLENFFEKHFFGIFTVNRYKTYAVWSTEEGVFYFNPFDNLSCGLTWNGKPGEGVAIVVRANCLKHIINHLLDNISKCTKFHLSIVPCKTERIVPIHLKPPETIQNIIPTREKIQETCEAEILRQKLISQYKDWKKKHPPPPPPPPPPEPDPKVLEQQSQFDEFSPDVDDNISVNKRPSWMQEFPEVDRECKIAIPEKIKPEKISFYKEIIPEKCGILRGNTSQLNPKFSRYKGKQSFANALAAFSMLRIYKSKDWTPKTVNKILKYGDIIYNEAERLKHLKGMDFSQIQVIDYPNKIAIENKFFSPYIIEYGLLGKLQSIKADVLDLGPALESFLIDNQCCVIFGPYIAAVWIESGRFYLFDPNNRNECGKVIQNVVNIKESEFFLEDIEAKEEPVPIPKDTQKDLKSKIKKNDDEDEDESSENETESESEGEESDEKSDESEEDEEKKSTKKNAKTNKVIAEKSTSISEEQKKNEEEENKYLEDGVACVIWFRSLKDLVSHYLNNLDVNSKEEKFHLCSVQINDYIDISDNWYNFKAISLNKWILQGTISQNDRQFDDRRNYQCSAIALIALGFAKVKNVKMWSPQTVDAIVAAGDELYKNTIEKLNAEQNFKQSALMLSELNKQYIHEKVIFNFNIEDCKINGLINPLDDDENLDLEKGLLLFFTNHKYGVVSSHNISVAIFLKDEAFYCFDSHSRDDKGLVSDFGPACILRVLTVPDLSKMIEANLGPYKQDIYNISKVNIEILPKLLGITQAPLNNYTSLNLNSSILRATKSSKSEKYKTTLDKQVIPMCLMALGFNKIWPSNLWSAHDVDEILDKGNDHYIQSIIFNDNVKEIQEDDYLTNTNFAITTDNVKKCFNIGINKIDINFDIVDEGNIHDKLQMALRTIYEKPAENENSSQEFILESQPLSVAIWKDDKSFFVFDPRPRDLNGQVIGKGDWSEYIPTPFDYSDGAEEFGYSEVFQNKVYAQDETEDDSETDVDEDMESNDDKSEESNDENEISKNAAKSTKSRDFWSQQELSEGAACVMKFNTLFSFIDYIMENIPPNASRNLNFTLKKVEVVNKPVIKEHFDPNEDERTNVYAGDWFNFTEIEYGKWCLRGTMNLYSETFPLFNKGKQALPMSIIALIFAFIYPLRCFKSANIDRILQYGDKLFTYVLRKKKENFLKKNKNTKQIDTPINEEEINRLLITDTFKMEDLINNLCMAEHLIKLSYEKYCKVGDVYAKDDQNEILTLKKGIYNFLQEDGKYGILQAKNLTVAIWKGEKIFYMFDPFNRGPNGLKYNPGVACITRYLKFDDLADVFLNNLDKLGKNTFFIHKIIISKDKCLRERAPTQEPPFKMPNVGGYHYIVPGKYILRGSRCQEDIKYQPYPLNFAAPISIIALTMSLIHKPNTWSKPIVDEILDVAYDLYNDSINELGFEFNPWEDSMTVFQVKRDYNIGIVKANCELKHTDQIGIIDTKDETIQNLRTGIINFFEENSYGILVTQPLTVAIWEQQEENEKEPLIYMYDPNSRGPLGGPCSDGTACVMVFVNATIAAEHIINCILYPENKKGEYRLIPIEIVIGKTKKKSKGKLSGKREKEIALPRCSKIVECEAKRKIREITEKERKERQLKKLLILGRKCWHKISNGIFLIRGTKSQNHPYYSEFSKGKQDISNCIASVIMNGVISIDNWNFKHIDLALDTGNQVYVDSYIAYKSKDPKLGMKNIVRTFFLKNVEVHVTVYKSIITSPFTQDHFNSILFSYFQRERYCIINICDYWISIFFISGYYYLFDPHDFDEKGNKIETDGCAVVLRFDELQQLTEKITNDLKNMLNSVNFTLWLIEIDNIKQ